MARPRSLVAAQAMITNSGARMVPVTQLWRLTQAPKMVVLFPLNGVALSICWPVPESVGGLTPLLPYRMWVILPPNLKWNGVPPTMWSMSVSMAGAITTRRTFPVVSAMKLNTTLSRIAEATILPRAVKSGVLQRSMVLTTISILPTVFSNLLFRVPAPLSSIGPSRRIRASIAPRVPFLFPSTSANGLKWVWRWVDCMKLLPWKLNPTPEIRALQEVMLPLRRTCWKSVAVPMNLASM